MKISILLPYKENFSPEYAGAVSLFIKDTVKISHFKKNITVFGNTKYKKGFNIKYKNLKLKKRFLNSTSKLYVNSFLKVELKRQSDLIEIHNRPSYVKYISKSTDTNLILYYHNDPLSMNGSISEDDRTFLLNKCKYIIVISEWIKKRFLTNLQVDQPLLNKIIVIPHSTNKINNTDIVKKKKI